MNSLLIFFFFNEQNGDARKAFLAFAENVSAFAVVTCCPLGCVETLKLTVCVFQSHAVFPF